MPLVTRFSKLTVGTIGIRVGWGVAGEESGLASLTGSPGSLGWFAKLEANPHGALDRRAVPPRRVEPPTKECLRREAGQLAIAFHHLDVHDVPEPVDFGEHLD